MMASSSSSSNLTDQLLQDELPWPSSSLPFASVLHSVNHHWSQPLMLNSADELQLLLSAQGHHHIHQDASPVIPPQLISPSMMQDLGFQWSNCGSADSTAMLFMSGELQQDGHNMIKEEQRRESSLNSRSSCAAAGSTAAIAYNDILGGGSGLPAMAAADDLNAGIVLPSINISRPLQKLCPPPPPLPGDAFEILASSRLCKTLLLGQASSVLLHNGMPLLRSERVPYGPPPPEAAAVHPHQGPRIDNYKMAVVNAMGGGRHWGAETNAAAACHQKTTVPSSSSSSPAPSPKKPRLESQSSNAVVPSFKVRKEKLGDRIAALQQLVCPFGKTDTASVLMEAIGYINFLQDQVKTLSGPYLWPSRTNKPKTKKRGSPNGNGEEQEETRLDLRSRGLCLVPLSCTSYVTNENGVWAPPNFSGN